MSLAHEDTRRWKGEGEPGMATNLSREIQLNHHRGQGPVLWWPGNGGAKVSRGDFTAKREGERDELEEAIWNLVLG